jgi:Tfp pilus assembly protein PilN
MKAVNLIPAEERRGAGGAAGRSGGGAYILLGALALLVIMFAAYATTKRSVNEQQAQLTTLERDAAAGEARAAALAPYTAFAALRTARVATVQSIADSRFDWAHAMHELGRTLPRDITLTALTGSVSVNSAGNGGGGVALRAAYDVPAIELTGCAPGQGSIPPMLAALRQVDGVRRVALQQSIKSDVSPTATAAADGTKVKPADCRRTFQAVVFFDAKPQPSAAAAAAAPVAGAPGTPAAAVPAAPAAAGTVQNVNGGAK